MHTLQTPKKRCVLAHTAHDGERLVEQPSLLLSSSSLAVPASSSWDGEVGGEAGARHAGYSGAGGVYRHEREAWRETRDEHLEMERRPSVRAGFMLPPVKGPSAKTPTIMASPIASGAAFLAAEHTPQRQHTPPRAHSLADATTGVRNCQVMTHVQRRESPGTQERRRCKLLTPVKHEISRTRNNKKHGSNTSPPDLSTAVAKTQ